MIAGLDIIRARWAEAPRVGPWSRSKLAIELLRNAQPDIDELLAATEGMEPVADLFVELDRAGATNVRLRPLVALAGRRGRYGVQWSQEGREHDAEGWNPAVALRRAVRAAEAVSHQRGGQAGP